MWADERARLLAIRDKRIPPTRDDKVVAAWNGLAIAGLAEAGLLFGRPDFIEAACGIRMAPRRREHLLVRLGGPDRLPVGGLVHAHGEHSPHSDPPRPIDELRVGGLADAEMGMRIHHGRGV